MRLRLLGTLLVVALATWQPASAKEISVTWEYPAGYDVTFTVSVFRAGEQDAKRYTVSSTRFSWGCPAPDVYAIWVTAVRQGQESPRSQVLTCLVTPEKPCACTDVDSLAASAAEPPQGAEPLPATPDPSAPPAKRAPRPPPPPEPISLSFHVDPVTGLLVIGP